MSRFTPIPGDDDANEYNETAYCHDINHQDMSETPPITNGQITRTLPSPSPESVQGRYSRYYKCCVLCRTKNIADSLLSDSPQTDSHSTLSTKQKAKEALVVEQCLDASVSILVERSSWVNASALALTLKTSFWIDFPSKSKEVARCQNAWIYVLIIFILCIMVLILPLYLCEPIDSLRKELERKQENDELRDSMASQTRRARNQSYCAEVLYL